MRTINASKEVSIPVGVTCAIKSRIVVVTGPRGTLERDFKFTKIDLKVIGEGKTQKVVAELWFGNKKALAGVRSVISAINNMIIGVTKGYEYKMRMVYSHFPINVSIENGGKEIAIRNFLGEKVVRIVNTLAGVEVERSADVKDELVLRGSDINNVSQTAANIQQSTRAKNKDIRKFLDGIYVSSKENIVKD
jgi:large subunit ribosomal protein L9e